MSEQFNYDVFISHSAKDKPAVRELAERCAKTACVSPAKRARS